MFDSESNNCRFFIVVRIEKVDFRNILPVSFLVVDANIIDKTSRIERVLQSYIIKCDISCFYKSLKSILLLFRKIDLFLIRHSCC